MPPGGLNANEFYRDFVQEMINVLEVVNCMARATRYHFSIRRILPKFTSRGVGYDARRPRDTWVTQHTFGTMTPCTGGPCSTTSSVRHARFERQERDACGEFREKDEHAE